jgi:thioredoxin 1
MSAVTDVTDATFATEVLGSDRPVLVDYWADWCSPCKQLSPIIDELARQYDGRLNFCKLDTNANTQIPIQQGVMALPTIQIFVGGHLVSSMQGGKTKAGLIKAIDAALEA